MTELIHVPFHGDIIEAVQDQAGKVWVPVKRICERLGLDRKSQQTKLAEKEWATRAMITLVAEDGKAREMFCLERECLPMWLATIEASRVGEDVRPVLVLYQREAARVLADYFLRGESSRPGGLDLPTVQAMIVEAIKQSFAQLAPILEGFANRIVAIEERLAHMAPVAPPASFHGVDGGRATGTYLGIRERVRKVWPTASEASKAAILNLVRRECGRRGIPCVQLVENGPYAVDQVHLPLVDQCIEELKARRAAKESYPIFERFTGVN